MCRFEQLQSFQRVAVFSILSDEMAVALQNTKSMISRFSTTFAATLPGQARFRVWLTIGLVVFSGLTVLAQRPSADPRPTAAQATKTAANADGTIGTSADYVIGPTDVLGVVFWGERELTLDVTVRPDGKISLPLFNDVVAAGSTPEQLRGRLSVLAKQFFKEPVPVVTIMVRQVNNNRAYITGQVQHPGPYPLAGPTTVLQMIAIAGGFSEFADRNHVIITRAENGVQRTLSFSYDDVIKRKDMSRNIVLKPGDTVVVP